MSEQDGHNNPRHNGRNMQKWEKVTFYLTPEQVHKLDMLVYLHNNDRNINKRINRNDIVRMLIEDCTLEKLLEIARQ